MAKEIGNWEDEEVKTLFRFVEVKKSEGVPLIKIFKEFADKTCRHQNSVRNYYYKEIKSLGENIERLNKLKIKLKNHVAKKPLPFNSGEAKNTINQINQLIEKGYSVRRACLHLACGDATKMVRLQNKYRSEVKSKKEDNMNNIIKMPTNNIMSDEDINALFLGLIKLVKRQEAEKAKMHTQIELLTANDRLKQALKEIVLKKAQIEKLQEQITLLNEQITIQKEKEVFKKIKYVQSRTAKDIIGEFVAQKQPNKKLLKI